MKKIFGTLAIIAMALTGTGCVHAYGSHHSGFSQLNIGYHYTGSYNFHGHAPKHIAPKHHGQANRHSPSGSGRPGHSGRR